MEPRTVRAPRWRAMVLAGLLACAPLTAMAQEVWHFLAPHGHVVAAHYSLRRATHGIDGALELMLDDRLTGRMRREYAQMYWYGVTGNVSVEESVTGQSLVPAVLRLVDIQGDRLAEFPLSSPIAEVYPIALNSAEEHEFMVLVQQGGFGAFNGTLGLPLAVVDGAIQTLDATDALSGALQTIELQRTQRTDWRIQRTAKSVEILQLSCDPDDVSDDGFREVFARYRRGARGWVYETRLDRGYCSWLDDFPPRDLFP